MPKIDIKHGRLHQVDIAEMTITNVMKAYAQDAERLASEQGISLDYTEESLERVSSGGN